MEYRFLRRRGIDGIGPDRDTHSVSPGTTRLAPIVDIRLEADAMSSDLVAAGYTCCSNTSYAYNQRSAKACDLDNSMLKFRLSAIDRHRYLWIRRATNHIEAHDHAIVDLRFTAGRMSDMTDPMHTPPASDSTWEEVIGRQRRSMPLKRWNSLTKSDDLKLWCQRMEASNLSPRVDRVSLCLGSWRKNEVTFMRELERSVRLNLRQRHSKSMEKLTEPVDLSAIFNEHLPRGARKMTRSAWNELLHSAGLYMAQKERELLLRRLCRESAAIGIEREDFVSFVSKTEFELEESAFHLKQELRRRHRLTASKPRQKKLHMERLKSMLEQACSSGKAKLRGISMDLFGFMMKCIDEYLTEAEQVRLILRFDPNFRGSVSIEKFLDFIASERDAPRERAERVLLAAQSLCEFVHECKASAGETRSSQAWIELERRHLQRKQLVSSPFFGLFCTTPSTADRHLEPEDLTIAVERRGAHTAGVRGALRLSAHETRQLAMLIAPVNPDRPGLVGLEHWKAFFVSSRSSSAIRMAPRPLGDLLEVLSRPEFMGGVLSAYKAWYRAEESNTDHFRTEYHRVRDERIKEVIGDEAFSGVQNADPIIGVDNLFVLTWPYRDNDEGERPFDNASETALVALHVGADDIHDENIAMYAELNCIRVRTFFDGVCRLIQGDIEPVEEQRVAKVSEASSLMSVVCDDLRGEIRLRAVDGRQRSNYMHWLSNALIEFKVHLTQQHLLSIFTRCLCRYVQMRKSRHGPQQRTFPVFLWRTSPHFLNIITRHSVGG